MKRVAVEWRGVEWTAAAQYMLVRRHADVVLWMPMDARGV